MARLSVEVRDSQALAGQFAAIHSGLDAVSIAALSLSDDAADPP
ncbi:hypothetical protein ACFOHK_17640 [Falsigemmobacter intermedius]